MKTLYIIIVLMAMAVTTMAQKKANPLDVRTYKVELGLTQSQLTQIGNIHKDFNSRAKLQAPAPNGVDRLVQKMELMKERRAEVKKVLTIQQRKKYHQILKAKSQPKVQ